jgi:hypothetical protein
MIGRVPRKVATVLGLVTCVAGIGLVWGAGAEAFTGTRAALTVVRQFRVAAARFPAVRDVPSGYVAYCATSPLGWIPLPLFGCRENARVTEEIDLVRGRPIRVFGEVTARTQSTIRYVGSTSGWFQLDQGLDCWFASSTPFITQAFATFPFPGERIRIVTSTATSIVIGASAPQFQYHELDYVNPATGLIYRIDSFNSLGRQSYRVTDHLTYLYRRSRAPATTPVCA